MKKVFRFCSIFLILAIVFVTLAMPLSAMADSRKVTKNGDEIVTWTQRSGPDKGKTFSYTIPASERSWYAMAPFIMIGIFVLLMVVFGVLNSPKRPAIQRTLELIEARKNEEQK